MYNISDMTTICKHWVIIKKTDDLEIIINTRMIMKILIGKEIGTIKFSDESWEAIPIDEAIELVKQIKEENS